MFRRPSLQLLVLICLSNAGLAEQEPTREQQVQNDKQAFENNNAWFYDDLEKATAEAQRTKRPPTDCLSLSALTRLPRHRRAGCSSRKRIIRAHR